MASSGDPPPVSVGRLKLDPGGSGSAGANYIFFLIYSPRDAVEGEAEGSGAGSLLYLGLPGAFSRLLPNALSS